MDIAEGHYRGDMWENGDGYISISLYIGMNSHKKILRDHYLKCT